MIQKQIISKLALNIFLIFFISSCSETGNVKNIDKKNIKDTGVFMKNRFARHFEIERHNNYTLLHIKKPWQNTENINYKYVLINKQNNINNDNNIIRIPVKRVICMSSSHVAMIEALGKTDVIVGISGKKYINSKNILNKPDIKDVGYGQSLNYETIVNLNPDVVILYGVDGEVAGYQKKLNELGIKTIINADYLENTPLAKAEWLIFMGVLLNEEQKARTIFDSIANKYLALKKITDTIEFRPKVMTGLPWKDIWYISSGNSNLANLIHDAGADFLWKNDTLSDVMALDIESVIFKSVDADYWINTGIAESKKDILSFDSRLQNIKAFRSGNLFNNNAVLNINKGNDYFESGVVNPHIILEDLISIFHPDITNKHKLKYYKKIQ